MSHLGRRYFCLTNPSYYKTPNYYTVLGLTRNATLQEVKLGYFKMAKQFHPDTNKTLDAPYMFALIAEAYEVLSDPRRREEYDETGAASEVFGGRATGPGRQSTDTAYTAEEMYTKIFGQREADTEGEEVVHEDFSETYSGESFTREYIVKLSFDEAALGTEVVLTLRVVALCNKCWGSKSELGYQGKICPYCEGTGQETIKTGHLVARKMCSYCHGTKVFIRFKCHECEGIGRHIVDRPYKVAIPPGVVNGQVLKYDIDGALLRLPPEQIERDRHFWVTVAVEESLQFKRVGDDIHSRLEISPAMAVLGGKATVQGIHTGDKLLEVDIPAGTSSHRALVVAGEGIRADDIHPGDHVLGVGVRVPKKLSRKQKRILQAFAALEKIEDGTVDGVHTKIDHKYRVNVINPDKVKNRYVDGVERTLDMSLRDKIREKLGLELVDVKTQKI